MKNNTINDIIKSSNTIVAGVINMKTKIIPISSSLFTTDNSRPDIVTKDVSFLVGTSAQDNFDILDISDPDDIWFHVKGESSCHVIAKMSDVGEKIDKKMRRLIIKQGALLCKMESKYKSVKNLEIIYTKVKNVKKTATVGSVIAEPVSVISI
jgi:predicted ribosome quality control (RQC) complex YloA/Tae2 family protein